MSTVRTIKVTQLMLDEENPRLPAVQAGPEQALEAMVRAQRSKIRYLAEDIVEHGLDPSYRLIVMPHPTLSQRFIVLDGNRRLTTIRVLENPEAVAGVLGTKMLTSFRDLATRYAENPVDDVECLVVTHRRDADHWIELRHTGLHRGAGLLPWASVDAGRFRARRSGKPDLATQALDFLQARGRLSPEVRGKVRGSTLGRLLGTPDVRESFGVAVQDSQLTVNGDEERAVRLLAAVVEDLSTGRVSVGDLYTKAQRIDYAQRVTSGTEPVQSANQAAADPEAGSDLEGSTASDLDSIPEDDVDTTTVTHPAGGSTPLGWVGPLEDERPEDDSPEPAPPTESRESRTSVYSGPTRTHLIPPRPRMNITSERLRRIAGELRNLPIETYPNANAVLFRVFIELSADDYIERTKLQGVDIDSKLPAKLNAITNDLVARGHLSDQEAAPVRTAAQANSFKGIGTLLMNNWVHNRHMFPSPMELRIGWDNLQAWLSAVWPVATNVRSGSE